MLQSGNWAAWQAAVDAVLKGSPITQTSSSGSLAMQPIPPLKTYDIRHISKDLKPADIDKLKTCTRFKRSKNKSNRQVNSSICESWISQFEKCDNKEDGSMFSVETVEGLLVNQSKKIPVFRFANQTEGNGDDIGLKLTLALVPATLQPQL